MLHFFLLCMSILVIVIIFFLIAKMDGPIRTKLFSIVKWGIGIVVSVIILLGGIIMLISWSDDINSRKVQTQSPANQALSNTVGGTIGTINKVGSYAIPSIFAILMTDGASIPAQMAASAVYGAGSGLNTPTTEDGQIVDNVLFGAVRGVFIGIVFAIIMFLFRKLTKKEQTEIAKTPDSIQKEEEKTEEWRRNKKW